MDFADVATRQRSDDGVEFVFTDSRTNDTFLGDDGKPVVFTLYGIDAPRIKAALRARRRKLNAEVIKRAEIQPDMEVDDLAEVIRDEMDAAEELAIMTRGWSSNLVFFGEKLSFSIENAVKLYYAVPVLHAQMAEKVRARVNFMSTSASA